MSDLTGLGDWRHFERAFFGEESQPVGPPLPSHVRADHTRGTVDELRMRRVSEGLCARASCSGELDAEKACPKCGWSLVEEQARDRLRAKSRPEDREDYVPRLPGALFIDEYAEANIDEDAA